MNKTPTLLTLCLATGLSLSAIGQRLYPLEPVSNHYQTLGDLSSMPDPAYVSMDTIEFPSNGRASGKQFVGLEPAYLEAGDYEILKKLVSPPANSSVQTRAELQYLLEWQEKRTPSNRSRAFEIARIGYWPPMAIGGSYGDLTHLFWECRSIVGETCIAQDYPQTTKVLAGIMRDVRIAEFTLKYHHNRPRPYHLEPKLDPMGRVANPSFASGHTLWAYSQAFFWSELMPNRRREFLDLAFEVGESREIMGIHYPSDEEAARILSHKLLELMMKNPAFINDFDKAKMEWH
ncbi:MAG: phosphatase PAP2 family protein [Bacteroidota bacterium]